ncbi:MAG: DUF2892 domain-containing protein [Kineosporiaceae bacterium]
MQKNMGTVDRVVRAALVAPVALVVAVVAGPGSALGVVALVVAGVMLATAAVGFCPLYRVFRISTCPRRQPVAR